MPKYYTGIGSRQTPQEMQEEIKAFAACMGRSGWTMRSGAAQGADEAFELGAPVGQREIYLPWKSFTKHWSSDCIVPSDKFAGAVYMKALRLAQQHHPYWDTLKPGARSLMARNVFQLLGQDLQTPSAFVLCWASNTRMENGKIVDVAGGTGLAVRLAKTFNVPVYNLDLVDHFRAMRSIIEKEELAKTTKPALAPASGVRL